MSQNIVECNDETLGATIAQGVTLVDFWAPWCGPCKKMLPVLEEVAEEVGARAKIVKVNIDENQTYANQLQVQSIPTLVVYKDGQQVQRFVGAQSKSTITSAIQAAINA